MKTKNKMMREIKFKAKTIGNEWVFGNVSHLKKDFSTARKGHYISNSAGAPFAFMVRPETICQFTGLQDKNGVEIYEGDKVKVINKPYNVKNSVVVWGKKSNGWSLKCEVIKENSYDPEIKYYGLESGKSLEVIGSIHTTPELLNPSNK